MVLKNFLIRQIFKRDILTELLKFLCNFCNYWKGSLGANFLFDSLCHEKSYTCIIAILITIQFFIFGDFLCGFLLIHTALMYISYEIPLIKNSQMPATSNPKSAFPLGKFLSWIHNAPVWFYVPSGIWTEDHNPSNYFPHFLAIGFVSSSQEVKEALDESIDKYRWTFFILGKGGGTTLLILYYAFIP